jgi:O-antigen ligase
MPNTTIVWFILYCVFLLGSFVNPLFGTLGYLFEYYLRPSMHWWGRPLPDWRWNFTIAAVLTVTYLLRRSSLPRIGKARTGPATCLIGLLLVMLLVTPLTAVNRTLSWDRTVSFSKLLLFHGLIVGTVRTELAFDAVAAIHMAGAGWWGWEAYTNPKRTAGRLQNVGSGDTLGDNGTAAHLLTVIPFIAVYLVVSRKKRLQSLAFLVAPFVLNTFILCNSRGALLGLIAAAGAAVWLTKSGNRVRMIGAGVALVAGLYVLADPQFLARQEPVNYEEDSSAVGRLEAWRGSLDLIQDYPFGAGGQGFWELSPIYVPDLVERSHERRDPHNTLVLVASEWGVLGLLLLLGFYYSSFRLLREVRRQSGGGIWYYRSVAIQVSMIGLFVAGIFTDRLYAEAPYWLGGLAVALHRVHSHVRQAAANTETMPPPVEPQPSEVFSRAV